MARRTKEEAAETRSRILDTAEQVFLDKGVARTSLDDIAEAAGVTRGAIYWHFKNKADLFEAMMQRMKLPLEDMMEQLGQDHADNPIETLRARSLAVLKTLAVNAQWQRVSEICRYKVEYVDEMESYLRARDLECRDDCLNCMETSIREAAQKGMLHPDVNPRVAAIGFHALFDGIISNWILDRKYLSLPKGALPIIDTYLKGLMAHPEEKSAKPKKTKKRAAGK